jgi:DNA-binding IclR family transcriptional regulator
MKSIHKVFDVLEVFVDFESDEIRLSELAKESSLDKSTVNRIVSVLVERGYLSQKEKWGKYSLGTKFLNFSGAIKRRMRIRDISMPYLLELFKDIGESVILATWDGRRAFYREVIDSEHPLRISPDDQSVLPLYGTGIGKIILAYKTQEELERYFQETELVRLTENTIVDPVILTNQLKKVARENVAFDDEECFDGARNVSSGIRDAEGNIVACVGVMTPSVRLTKAKMKKIAPRVRECAEAVSRALGYQGPAPAKRETGTAAGARRPKNRKRRIPIAQPG